MGLRILVYHNRYAAEFVAELEKHFPGHVFVATGDAEMVKAEIGQTDILIATGQGFPREALAQARRLKYLQSTSAGIDWVMNSPLPEEVLLCRAEGVHDQPVAEYVAGNILADCLFLHDVAKQQSARTWKRPLRLMAAGRRVGVVGLGMVGRAIAAKLKALDMTVTAIDSRPVTCDGLDRVYALSDMAFFLSEPDYVVLSVPLNEGTRGMFGLAQFKQMRPSAVLVNVSRGPVVRETDLVFALKQGVIAKAILDVFVDEPLPEGSELWALPNAVITPHMAGFVAGHDHFMGLLVENLTAFLAGGPLKGRVDRKTGY